jgi:hypothetical protein
MLWVRDLDMSSKAHKMKDAFARKILREIYGPIKDNTGWRVKYFKTVKFMIYIRI